MKSIITVCLMIGALQCLAQKKTYTVGGRVNVPNPKGQIYVFLCNEESFSNRFSGVDTVSYWVNYDKVSVDYEFENVKPGKYSISSYQDVNGNHKLDKWLLGPREPWGFSYMGKMRFPPAFSDVSFNVNYDTRVNITLGK